MKAKLLEVRDVGTFIPVLAVNMRTDNEGDRYLAGRAGYGRTAKQQADFVWVAKMTGSEPSSTYDPHGWPGSSRTMTVAHQYIVDHFDELKPGAVVDVEHILGITETPKESERVSSWWWRAHSHTEACS